jgi:hypothetical protein
MSKKLLAAAALACLIAAPLAGLSASSASAQNGAQNYAAEGVDVIEAAAIVHVIPENRTDISVVTQPGRRLPAPEVRQRNGRVIVDGGLRGRIRGCGGGWFGSNNSQAATINGLGSVTRADLPIITIRTPMHVDLTAAGAVYADIGAFTEGAVRASGCGQTDIGPVSGALNAALHGSGDMDIASAGALSASLSGSGDIRAGNADTANLNLAGSGDVRVRTVRQNLRARLAGSGDIKVDRVDGGETELSLAGSGDVEVAAVTGDLRVRLNNSGDISVGNYQGGDADLELSGSGNISIRAGTAATVSAQLSGSGNVNFNGRAQNARADLNGSGNVRIAHADHIERMRESGSGEVSIGQ